MKKLFTVFSVAALSLLLSACGGGGGGGSSSSTPPSVGTSPAVPSQTAANQVQTSAACDSAQAATAIGTWLNSVRPGGTVIANDRGVVCVRDTLNLAASQMLPYGASRSGDKALAATTAASAGYTGTVLSYVYAEGASSEQNCLDKLDAYAGGLMRVGQLQDVGAAVEFASASGDFRCGMIAAAKQGAGNAGQVPVAGALPRYHVYQAGFTLDSAGPQVVLSLLTRNSADRCAAGSGCYPVVRSISVVSADPQAQVTFEAQASSPLSVPTRSGVQLPSPRAPLSVTGGLLRLTGLSPTHCATQCTLEVVYDDELGVERTMTVYFDNNGEVS